MSKELVITPAVTIIRDYTTAEEATRSAYQNQITVDSGKTKKPTFDDFMDAFLNDDATKMSNLKTQYKAWKAGN